MPVPEQPKSPSKGRVIGPESPKTSTAPSNGAHLRRLERDVGDIGFLARNFELLIKMGFEPKENARFYHPKLKVLIDSSPAVVERDNQYAAIGQRMGAAFVYEQKVPGRTQVFNPAWSLEETVMNIEKIVAVDLTAVVQVNLFRRSPEEVEKVLIHEVFGHALDSQTPEGRKHLAHQLTQIDIQPEGIAHTIGYGIWTELRAYAAEGHRDISQATKDLSSILASQNTRKDQMDLIAANSEILVNGLLKVISPALTTFNERGEPERIQPSRQQLSDAAVILADLIGKYGVEATKFQSPLLPD